MSSSKKKASNGDEQRTRDDWFSFVYKSFFEPPVVVDRKKLPGFPSDTLQEATTSQSGLSTLKEAFVFYGDCLDTFKLIGVPLKKQSTHSFCKF